MLTTAIASDSLAFMDSMDPMYSSMFSENDLQSSYFDLPITGNEDYLVSPLDTTFSTSTSVAPNMLGTWGIEDTSLNDAIVLGNNPLDYSRTPSLCSEDSSNPSTPAGDSSLSPKSPELEPPPKRKRGRPRLDRAESDPSYGMSSRKAPRISKRQPHNEVERKYREGLNAELERLRLAIPTLPQWDGESLSGPPKSSKATVLATAIDYIRRLEREKGGLRAENQRLKGGRGMRDILIME